jgi:hypothetical protein
MQRSATFLVALTVLASLGAEAIATGGFKPADGRYAGTYTSSNHGPGALRLQVGTLRPGLPGVRLLKWSGKLRCPGHRTQMVAQELTAARAGRTFSGYVTFPGGRDAFTGSFTAGDALRGTVRVIRGSGPDRCDTGAVTFVAHRVGP